MIAGVLVFVNRPGAASLPPELAEAVPVQAQVPAGRLACAFDPGRSRVTVSVGEDATLDWKGRACTAEGAWTQVDGRWQRIALREGGAASLRRYDPVTLRLDDTRWLLSAGEAARIRRLAAPDACGADADRLAQAQAAIRASLPPIPNEKLSYRCSPAR
jgi:hypothetical protein